MAPFVLAQGVLMVVIGGYEIYFGSGYISVERGWSAFISGFVLLTGGLVTIAVGVAIHALRDLKAALIAMTQPAAGTFASDVPGPEPRLDFPQDELTLTLDEQPSRMLVDTLTPDLVPPPPEAPDFTTQTRLRAVPPRTSRPLVADIAEVAPSAGDHATLLDPVRPELDSIDEPTVTASQAAETDIPMPVENEIEPALPPTLDDWLDRRFADLDRDVSDRHLSPTQEPTSPSDRFAQAHVEPQTHSGYNHTEKDAVEADHDRVEPAASFHPTDEMDPRDEKAEAYAAEPSSSPVIGRYESEGTSYVMYADGSIEAQSEAGVYRFASMAELKSFIEG